MHCDKLTSPKLIASELNIDGLFYLEFLIHDFGENVLTCLGRVIGHWKTINFLIRQISSINNYARAIPDSIIKGNTTDNVIDWEDN